MAGSSASLRGIVESPPRRGQTSIGTAVIGCDSHSVSWAVPRRGRNADSRWTMTHPPLQPSSPAINDLALASLVRRGRQLPDHLSYKIKMVSLRMPHDSLVRATNLYLVQERHGLVRGIPNTVLLA